MSKTEKSLADKLNRVLELIPFDQRKVLVLNQPMTMWRLGGLKKSFIGDEKFRIDCFIQPTNGNELRVRVICIDGEDKDFNVLHYGDAIIALTGFKEFYDSLMMLVDDISYEQPKEIHEEVKEDVKDDPLWGTW